MRKGYFLFVECGAFSNKLTVLCIISFVVSLILIIVGAEPNIHAWYFGLIDGLFEFRTIHAWIIFFFSMGLILLTVNLCMHKICSDVATLINELDDKK